MTYDQYWNMDCTLVKAYRKAAEIRRGLDNQQAWLQGMYIYNALCCVAPAFNSLKPKKPKDYPHRPYELKSENEERAEQRVAQQEKQDAKAKTMMELFALHFNKRFEKGGGTNAR